MQITVNKELVAVTAETAAEGIKLLMFYQANCTEAKTSTSVPAEVVVKPKRAYTRKLVRNNKQWADEELELVLPLTYYKPHCGHGEVAKIAKKLRRTTAAVSAKISELRVSAKPEQQTTLL